MTSSRLAGHEEVVVITIHLEQLQHREVVDRPALGAFIARPEVIEAQRAMARTSAMSFLDYTARTSTLRRLVLVHEATRAGRHLHLVAADLRALADELEGVLQPRTGGWPIREAA